MQTKQRPLSQNIYLIGIKGVGMTALAQLLKKQGHHVSGSDTHEVFFTDKILKQDKIKVYNGFAIQHIPADVTRIVYSAAYNQENNIEVAEACRRKLPVVDLTHATAEVFNGYAKNIAVCGTHGKSTVTALLSFVLHQTGKQPSALIGSGVPQLGGNALAGKSELMVLEADEYQNKLAHYNPYGVILNNIEYDHPDYFKNFATYKKVFRAFVKRVPPNGFVVANWDDEDVRDACKNIDTKVISYSGTSRSDIRYCPPATRQQLRSFGRVALRAGILDIKNGYQFFKVDDGNKDLSIFKTKLIGEHNVRNAVAVIAACLELKVPVKKIKKALAQFKGLARRMEVLGSHRGAIFIDDYAHHPSEVRAALAGARLRYPGKRISCVFMPHTFSRTEALFNDFTTSFHDADRVIILPVYSSARESKGSVTSRDLSRAIKGARYSASMRACANYLKKYISEDDVVILMGAGDAFRVWESL